MIKLTEKYTKAKYNSEKGAGEFVDLLLFKNSTPCQRKEVLKYINVFNNDIGLWRIYKEIKNLVYDDNNKNNDKVKKKLEECYQSLESENIYERLYLPPLFRYIKDINSFQDEDIDAEINEVNETVKGNINKDIIEDFGNKLAFLYLFIYDNKVKNQEIGEINKQLIDYKKNLNSIKLQISDLKNQIVGEIKNNVYSEFITILGIFTAITFAIFGGMNLLSSLFKNIGNTTVSLGYTLILAAIFGIIIWGITELLFYWISKIKGITDSTKDKNKILFNWIAIIVLAEVLLLGVFLFTEIIK